jgi:hypothetical protein
MDAVKAFIRDYVRLMRGQPLFVGLKDRSNDEEDARQAGSRFSRGNIAIQDDLFATEADIQREREEVANFRFRN